MHDRNFFVRVDFVRFKAFRQFTIDLRHFNVLVGANNAGKSTILTAFRILSAGIRRANSKKATPVRGPSGFTKGHLIDLSAISVAEENIFYNYDDSEHAHVVFHLSNSSRLRLFFPEQGSCYLIPETNGVAPESPTSFRKHFDCSIGFAPILGPVEDKEGLFEKEAARNALYNYRAARNFRNIWFHFPDKFPEFQELLKRTWPGMDIWKPEVDYFHNKPRLNVYCPENRFPREIFWSGFGFQVWCQMLTHIVQNSDASIFLIDEPDIYLHSDLQRQLTNILKSLGPDIIVATHSTEIIAECEPDDIVLIDKKKNKSKRIKRPQDVDNIFSVLGSGLNPILTQLAKTRKVIFVEGQDFKLLERFAQKLSASGVSTRQGFAVIPVRGFNPERIRSLKSGIEFALGSNIKSGAILDRDYRCAEECEQIKADCEKFCDFVYIHQCKEIENYLLVPAAIDRALEQRLFERRRRSGEIIPPEKIGHAFLESVSEKKKQYVAAQRIADRRRYIKSINPSTPDATIMQDALESFELEWLTKKLRFSCLPGKDVLSELNAIVQPKFNVNLTPSGIISALHISEVDTGMRDLIKLIAHMTQ